MSKETFHSFVAFNQALYVGYVFIGRRYVRIPPFSILRIVFVQLPQSMIVSIDIEFFGRRKDSPFFLHPMVAGRTHRRFRHGRMVGTFDRSAS